MTHPRKIIRDAAVTLLTGATSAGTRVTPTRVEPHKKTDLPAISVYTLSEATVDDNDGAAPRELTRVVNLEITGWVAHVATLPADDAMDALAAQIEAAMDADPYLGGAAGDSILQGTELTIIDDGDPLVGVVTLTYAVTFRTTPGDPADPDDFLLAGVTTQVGGAGLDNAVEDLIEVQT